MADLDSRQKRASSVGLLFWSLLAPPLADGTLGSADRQHIAATYAGVLAANPSGSGVGSTGPLLGPGRLIGV